MKQKIKPPVIEKEISKSFDIKTNQDFPGFPFGISTEKMIHLKTEQEKKIASVDVKDGEKINYNKKNNDIDEAESDGSGGAFESTENTSDDDYDNTRNGK